MADEDKNSKRYKAKYFLLKKKYNTIDLGNCKLRNRIYHVKKEIKYLKRLKRILIQRLLTYGDRFMEVCLEIPDSEPGSNVEDQIIAEVAQLAASTSQQPSPTPPTNNNKKRRSTAAETEQNGAKNSNGPSKKSRPSSSEARKKTAPSAPVLPPLPPAREKPVEPRVATAAEIKDLSDAAKASVSNIIASVIDESMAERALAKASETAAEPQPQPPLIAALPPGLPETSNYDECFLTEDEKRALESIAFAPTLANDAVKLL